tara:strand:+ start:395 stop:1207 length:813 start_codon:yes stop_codon:yes gene_type:complete
MLEALVVRHPQSLWNLRNRGQGDSDADEHGNVNRISEAGQLELDALCGVLKRGYVPFKEILSSDLTRAKEPAEYTQQLLMPELSGIKIDKRLREVNIGRYTGVDLAKINKGPFLTHIAYLASMKDLNSIDDSSESATALTNAHIKPKDGQQRAETRDEASRRLNEFYQEFITYPPGKYLIFTHGMALQHLIASMMNVTSISNVTQGNCAINHFFIWAPGELDDLMAGLSNAIGGRDRGFVTLNKLNYDSYIERLRDTDEYKEALKQQVDF